MQNLGQKCHGKQMLYVDGSGYTNIWNHLVQCAGGKEMLKKRYDDAVKEAAKHNFELNEQFGTDESTETGPLGGYFAKTNTHTPKVKALYGWMKYVVRTNQPFSSIEDNDHRAFSKYKENFSAETLIGVIHEVVKLVEEVIAKELQSVKKRGGKVSIMHDGWTDHGDHYVGLLASFMREVRWILA